MVLLSILRVALLRSTESPPLAKVGNFLCIWHVDRLNWFNIYAVYRDTLDSGMRVTVDHWQTCFDYLTNTYVASNTTRSTDAVTGSSATWDIKPIVQDMTQIPCCTMCCCPNRFWTETMLVMANTDGSLREVSELRSISVDLMQLLKQVTAFNTTKFPTVACTVANSLCSFVLTASDDLDTRFGLSQTTVQLFTHANAGEITSQPRSFWMALSRTQLHSTARACSIFSLLKTSYTRTSLSFKLPTLSLRLLPITLLSLTLLVCMSLTWATGSSSQRMCQLEYLGQLIGPSSERKTLVSLILHLIPHIPLWLWMCIDWSYHHRHCGYGGGVPSEYCEISQHYLHGCIWYSPCQHHPRYY